MPHGIRVNQLTVAGSPAQTITPHPLVTGYAFPLASPLPPGDSLAAAFDLLLLPPPGFTGEKPGPNAFDLLEKSVGVLNSDFAPIVGYFDRPRVKDEQKRAAAGLPPLDPAAETARIAQYSAIGADADLVQYAATLSTIADHTAITSGELVREWTEGERRYFQYQSRGPIINQMPFLSGQYDVLRGEAQGILVEIYYHPATTATWTACCAALRPRWNMPAKTLARTPTKLCGLSKSPMSARRSAFPLPL
jgi:hypothetical protein